MRGKFGYIVNSATAFIPHPEVNAAWLRVHPAILLVACPGLIGCGAKKGERCKSYSNGKPIGYAHHVRVVEAQGKVVPGTVPLEKEKS